MRERSRICACLLATAALAGCGYLEDPLPKCSDDATLDLVREIVGEHALGESPRPSADVLRKRLTFHYPHATKLEENIRKYSCEAKLIVSGASQPHEIRLTYESQLDDAGDHLVQVSGINLLDAFAIKAALSVPEPQVASSTPAATVVQVAEPEAEAVEEASEAPAPTPEEIERNRAMRQAVLDGNGTPGEHPRFSEYVVQDLYNGPSATLDMSGDTAKTFRTRLRDALTDGEISAAGEYVQAGWGCGTSCYYGTFVNKRTGQVVENGIGGEGGERIVGLDSRSRLVISEGPELDDDYNELGYFAYFYELTDARLVLIEKVRIPRFMEE